MLRATTTHFFLHLNRLGMKKMLLFLAVPALCFSAYGQPAQKIATAYDQWVGGSRTQKGVATAGLVAGGALMIGGGVLYFSEYGNGLPGGTGFNERRSKTGEALFYTGLGLSVVSALLLEPFRKKGRLLDALPALPFVDVCTVPRSQEAKVRKRPYTCVGVQINF